MVAAIFTRPFYLAEIMEQMYSIGIGSLYLVVLTGVFAGQGFALAFSVELADFGAKNYLGRIMAISIVRELGPVLTALMIAARVAAGITAELGAMKSSNQIDAMFAFGIDPIKKLGRAATHSFDDHGAGADGRMRRDSHPGSLDHCSLYFPCNVNDVLVGRPRTADIRQSLYRDIQADRLFFCHRFCGLL